MHIPFKWKFYGAMKINVNLLNVIKELEREK